MENLGYLKDADFLRALDNEENKFYWVKIDVLKEISFSNSTIKEEEFGDKKFKTIVERPIESIAGRVLPGSTITIDGSSAVRRTCSITFVAEEAENNLTDVENLLSINKKIKIMVGIENHINDNYDKIIWFPQGVFVIVQPNISHSAEGSTIPCRSGRLHSTFRCTSS